MAYCCLWVSDGIIGLCALVAPGATNKPCRAEQTNGAW